MLKHKKYTSTLYALKETLPAHATNADSTANKTQMTQHDTFASHQRTSSTYPQHHRSYVKSKLYYPYASKHIEVSTFHAFTHHIQLIFCRSEANTALSRVKIHSLFVFTEKKFCNSFD